MPSTIDPKRMPELLTVRFRVGSVMRDKYVNVYLDDERVVHRKRRVMAPGEMEEVILRRAMFDKHPDLARLAIRVEDEDPA